MLQLQWIAEGGSMAGVPAPVVARRKNREKLAWGLLAAALLARRGARLRLRATRAEAGGGHAVRHRAASRDRDDGRAAPVSGRAPARLRRDRHGGQGAHLGAAPELADGAAAAGHRRGRSAVLVSRQPVRRIHRGRRDEEGRRHRRSADEDLRRARRLRRHLELGGRDPLRRHGRRSDLSRSRGGRNPDRGREARRGDARRRPWAGRSSCRTASTTSTC